MLFVVWQKEIVKPILNLSARSNFFSTTILNFQSDYIHCLNKKGGTSTGGVDNIRQLPVIIQAFKGERINFKGIQYKLDDIDWSKKLPFWLFETVSLDLFEKISEYILATQRTFTVNEGVFFNLANGIDQFV